MQSASARDLARRRVHIRLARRDRVSRALGTTKPRRARLRSGRSDAARPGSSLRAASGARAPRRRARRSTRRAVAPPRSRAREPYSFLGPRLRVAPDPEERPDGLASGDTRAVMVLADESAVRVARVVDGRGAVATWREPLGDGARLRIDAGPHGRAPKCPSPRPPPLHRPRRGAGAMPALLRTLSACSSTAARSHASRSARRDGRRRADDELRR